METTNGVQAGMTVYSSDGRQLGTVEHAGEDSFSTADQRLTLDAIERIEAGKVYLWGDGAIYNATDDDDETVAKRERSRHLPDTDARLYVNEREVESSLEERMPRDGQR